MLHKYLVFVCTVEQFKAMRMDTAHLVADGEGGVLGFTAARALRFRGCYVSYADVSGGGVRCEGLISTPWLEMLRYTTKHHCVR